MSRWQRAELTTPDNLRCSATSKKQQVRLHSIVHAVSMDVPNLPSLPPVERNRSAAERIFEKLSYGFLVGRCIDCSLFEDGGSTLAYDWNSGWRFLSTMVGIHRGFTRRTMAREPTDAANGLRVLYTRS